MTYVWYALGAIATIGAIATAGTYGLHRLIDWWENRNTNTIDWPTDDTSLDDLFQPEFEPADPWADNQRPEPEPIETFADEEPLLFLDLTAEYRQHNPHLAGNTETWMMPSPDIDQAIRDPYQRWNGFLPQLEPARVPAQRDGES